MRNEEMEIFKKIMKSPIFLLIMACLLVDEDERIRDKKPKKPETAQSPRKGQWKGDKSIHFCSECGWALMDTESGEPPYMGLDYHRENPERHTCCPGWNDWMMNFCPHCGADMRGK